MKTGYLKINSIDVNLEFFRGFLLLNPFVFSSVDKPLLAILWLFFALAMLRKYVYVNKATLMEYYELRFWGIPFVLYRSQTQKIGGIFIKYYEYGHHRFQHIVKLIPGANASAVKAPAKYFKKIKFVWDTGGITIFQSIFEPLSNNAALKTAKILNIPIKKHLKRVTNRKWAFLQKDEKRVKRKTLHWKADELATAQIPSQHSFCYIGEILYSLLYAFPVLVLAPPVALLYIRA